MPIHQRDFVTGDTSSTFGWLVKDIQTGAIISLVGITNAIVYYRAQNAPAALVGEVTPTTGGALGTITIKPGDESELEPALGQSQKYEAWAEFDLLGVHYVVPKEGPDSFTVKRLR